MGKGKSNKKQQQAFKLRFADDSSDSITVGFNPAVQLERMFPDVDKEVVHEVLSACQHNIEKAANTLIEMGLVQQISGPALNLSDQVERLGISDQHSCRMEAAITASERRPALGRDKERRSLTNARDPAVLSLPSDLMLKLFGYFRTVDLVVCSQCCQAWLELATRLLDATPRLDLKYQSNRYNLALLASCPRVSSIKVGTQHPSTCAQRSLGRPRNHPVLVTPQPLPSAPTSLHVRMHARVPVCVHAHTCCVRARRVSLCVRLCARVCMCE